MTRACSQELLEPLVIDNGSEPPVRSSGLPGHLTLCHNPGNSGVVRAMQDGYRLTQADYIVFTHSDVEMLEQDWDDKLRSVLAELERPGVVGLFGHRQVGTPEIYSSPYHPGRLSMAIPFCSAASMAPHGGMPPPNEIAGVRYQDVAALDGYMLCISRAFLDENGGFDLGLPAHHMYDTHTCLQAIELGYRNYVVGIDAHHHGGTTDSNENWAAPMGTTKQAIWEEAHRYVYDYWHPRHGRRVRLPFRTL